MRKLVLLMLLILAILPTIVIGQAGYWISKRVVYPQLWNVPDDKITNDGIILETKLKPVLNNETGYYDLYPENPNGLIVSWAGLPSFYLELEIPNDVKYIQFPSIIHLYHESVKDKIILYSKIEATHSYDTDSTQYYIFKITLYTYKIDLETQEKTLIDEDNTIFVTNTTNKIVDIYCIPTFYSYKLTINSTNYTVLIMGFKFHFKTSLSSTTITIAYDSYYLATNETMNVSYTEYIERLRELNGWKGFIGVGIAEYLPYYSHIEVYHTSYNETNPPPEPLYDRIVVKGYAFEDWYFDPHKLLLYFSQGLLEEYSGVYVEQKFYEAVGDPRIVDYYLGFLVPLAIAYALREYADPFFVYIISFVFLNIFFGLEFPILLATLIGGLAGFFYSRVGL